MRLAVLTVLATLLLAVPARADGLRRIVTPMARADGAVCDLLRAELGSRCKRIARDGNAAVYQSRSPAGAPSGIRRVVLAIDTGDAVLVGPAIDVLDDQLESARPTLRAIEIDGRRGVALDLVSTWRRGNAAEHAESLVGCMEAGAIWKCAQLDVGACTASLAADGSVTTSCGTTASLAVSAGR